MIATILLSLTLYIILAPLIITAIPFLIKKTIESRRKKTTRASMKKNEEIRPTLVSKIKKHISFIFTNKTTLMIKNNDTGVDNKIIFLGIYIIGFIITVILFNINMVLLGIITLLLFPYTAFAYGYISVKKIIEEREKKIKRLCEIAQKKLGYNDISNPSTILKVTEWNDLVMPEKITFYVPTGFDSSGEEGFLRLLNQIFGRNQTWVPDINVGGWDYEKGEAHFIVMPPLPTMAPWKEEYAIGPEIAESFFPVALGVEGGIELTDKETGEKIRLLGYDVAGETKDKAKEFGYNADASLMSASPQILVGGSTGSGKSISLKESVLAYKPLK